MSENYHNEGWRFSAIPLNKLPHLQIESSRDKHEILSQRPHFKVGITIANCSSIELVLSKKKEGDGVG